MFFDFLCLTKEGLFRKAYRNFNTRNNEHKHIPLNQSLMKAPYNNFVKKELNINRYSVNILNNQFLTLLIQKYLSNMKVMAMVIIRNKGSAPRPKMPFLDLGVNRSSFCPMTKLYPCYSPYVYLISVLVVQ